MGAAALLAIVVVAWIALRVRRMSTRAAPGGITSTTAPALAPAQARPAPVHTKAAKGTAPTRQGEPFVPDIGLVDAGPLRFVDLRRMPAPSLANGAALVVAAEVLRTESPDPSTIVWLVPRSVVETWLGIGPIGLALLASRMKAAHVVPGPDILCSPGHSFAPEQVAVLWDWQISLVDRATVVGAERTVSFEEVVATLDARAAPSRPVLPAVTHGSATVGDDLVAEISGLAIVDFRRVAPAALDGDRPFLTVLRSLRTLDAAPSLVVWIVAPWVLARWSSRRDHVLAKLRTLRAVHPAVGHRLAAYGAAGDAALLGAIGALGLEPLSETIECGTRDGQRLRVAPLDALLDVRLASAAVDARVDARG